MIRLSICWALVGATIGAILGGTPPADASAVYSASGSCAWNHDEEMTINTDGDVINSDTTWPGGPLDLVSCDLPTPGYTSASTTADLAVYYYDGNNGTGMEDSVICNVRTCNLARTTCNFEVTQYSCSTGGCSTPPGAWTGDGLITLADLNRPAFYTTTVYCYIPVIDSTAPSRVKSLWYIY